MYLTIPDSSADAMWVPVRLEASALMAVSCARNMVSKFNINQFQGVTSPLGEPVSTRHVPGVHVATSGGEKTDDTSEKMTNCDRIDGGSWRPICVWQSRLFTIMMFWFSDTDPSKVCMDLSKHQRFENHTSYLWRTRGGCPVRTESKDKENDVAHLSIGPSGYSSSIASCPCSLASHSSWNSKVFWN